MVRFIQSFNNQKGYLLLETLITASILLSLLPVVALKSAVWFDEEAADQFLQSYETLLYDAQLTALSERKTVNVELNEGTHEAYAFISPSSHIQTLQAPSTLHFQAGSLPLKIRFTSQGTIGQAGTFFIYTRSSHYQFTFLLGQGRFYVKKQ